MNLAWLPFYTQDFLASTQDMGPATVGGYIRLLCWQWDRGVVPIEQQRILRITGWTADEFRSCWPEVVERLDRDEDGFRHPRLASIREAQFHKHQDVTEKRREAAQRRWDAKAMQVQCKSNANAMQVHMQKHTEPEPEPEPDIRSTNTDTEPPASQTAAPRRRACAAKASEEECREYAASRGFPKADGSAFFDSMEANGWKTRVGPVRDWQAAFRTREKNGWLSSQQNGGRTPQKPQKPLTDRPAPPRPEIPEDQLISQDDVRGLLANLQRKVTA